MGTKNQTPSDALVRAFQSVEFFRDFRADELGSTKIVRANTTLGFRGEEQKMIDLTKPDDQATPIILSLRSEYSINQATVSQEPSQPFPIGPAVITIINATNATPVVITTNAPHGYATGEQVRIIDLRGTIQGNGVFTITVITPTTFSLNGTIFVPGNGYTGGGIVTNLSIPAATNTAPIVITTPTTHGLITGMQIQISGIQHTQTVPPPPLVESSANGIFTITVITPFTFSLNGSVGNGTYLGGGEYTFLVGPAVADGDALLGSPLVARIQWGVGGGKNELEIDIPAARLPELIPPLGFPANQPVPGIGNGTQIYLNVSHISVYARNDGNLSPLTAPGQDRVGGTTPAKIIAFVAPGASRGGPPLQRTIFVAGGQNIGFPLTPGNVVNVPIPPFARRVRFQRLPIATTPLRVTFQNNFGGTYREFNIPINFEGPIDVEGFAQTLRIQNDGAVNVTELQAVFDVDPI